MKSSKSLIFVAFWFLVSTLSSGCVVRTYTLTKDRVDQELAGNRGYLQGNPPPYEGKRKSTRQTTVVEVELGQPQVEKIK